MMKKIMLVITIVTLFATVPYAETIDVERVCEAISDSRTQYGNWKAKTREEFIRLKQADPVNFTPGKSLYRIPVSRYSTDHSFFCRGEKIRKEVLGVSNKSTHNSVFNDIRIYDGERTYTYSIRQASEKSVEKSKAVVYPGLSVGFQGDPLFISYGVHGTSWDGEFTYWSPLEDALLGKTQAGIFTSMGQDKVDGLSCMKFTSEESDGIVYKVWVIPDRNYCVRKTEITTPSERIVVDNTYTQNGDLWILNESVEASYDRFSGKKLMETRTTTLGFVPFAEISDSVFVMEYPEGIKVLRFDQQERIPVE